MADAKMETVQNGFRPNVAFSGAWLKPGVNETKRAKCREFFLRQGPNAMYCHNADLSGKFRRAR